MAAKIQRNDFNDINIPNNISLPEFVLNKIEEYGDDVAFVSKLLKTYFIFTYTK